MFPSRVFAVRRFAARVLAARVLAAAVLVAALLLVGLASAAAWPLGGPTSATAWPLGGPTSATAWPLGGPTSKTAWLWPLPPPRTVTRPFEAPASAYAAGHRGLDLSARAGAPVFASADGVVSFSGIVAGRPVLSVSHPGDLVSSVEPVLGVVVEGDRVVAGQLVGRLASGGHCADACLHFGVRLHGQYVSPMLLLGGIPRAVLLPLAP